MILLMLLAIPFGIWWSVGLTLGFELKTTKDWSYAISGFLMLVLAGISVENLGKGIFTGIVLALISLWTGPYVYKKRKSFEE